MREVAPALIVGSLAIALVVGGFLWAAHVAADEAAKRDEMAEMLFDQCSENGGGWVFRVGNTVTCVGDGSEIIWIRELTQ